MEKETGTIDDLVIRAKTRFTDIESQMKYIKIGLGLIRRDYPSTYKSQIFHGKHYIYRVEGYSSEGFLYLWEDIYRGIERVASVLEVMRQKDNFEVLFTSNNAFPGPIFPNME